MRRIGLAVILALSLFLGALVADAQQASRIYRVGFLATTTQGNELSPVAALRDGLRDLGYVEGRNLAIEYRWADDKYPARLRHDSHRCSRGILRGVQPPLMPCYLDSKSEFEAYRSASRIWDPLRPTARCSRHPKTGAAEISRHRRRHDQAWNTRRRARPAPRGSARRGTRRSGGVGDAEFKRRCRARPQNWRPRP